MSVDQIKQRRLEIAVELAKLAELECDVHRRMLSFHREIAELDCSEAAKGPLVTCRNFGANA